MKDVLLTRGEFFRKLAEDIANENFVGVGFLLGLHLVPWQLDRMRKITLEKQLWDIDQLEDYYHTLQSKQALLAMEHARDAEMRVLSTLRVLESAFDEREMTLVAPELQRSQNFFCQVADSLERTYAVGSPGDKEDFQTFIEHGNSWTRSPSQVLTAENIVAINKLLDRPAGGGSPVRAFIAQHVVTLLKTAKDWIKCSDDL